MKMDLNAKFVSKLDGGLQELEETEYWIELLLESRVVTKERLALIMTETSELLAILTTCSKNVKKKIKNE